MRLGRLVAASGLAAVLAAGPALATPAAAAPKPGYVAIVVSGHGTYCVQWTSGITGDAVLNKVATVAYRSDGIILQIDGDPSSGSADDTHYWSYWHDTSGSWTYSNYGASSYDPKAGSVEGWSYDNGQSNAPSPSQNPSGLYAALCGKYDRSTGGGSGGGSVASPTTSSSRPRTPTRTRTAPSHRPSASHPESSPARTSAAVSTPAATATPSRPSPSASRSRPTTAASDPTTSASATATATATATGSTVAPGSLVADGRSTPPASASAHSSGSPVGLIVGIGLVVVLGAGAGAVALRRRAAGG